MGTGVAAAPFDSESTDAQLGRIRIRPSGQSRACLIMLAGAFPGETYLLEPTRELTIGRSAGNDVRLPYNDISRVHAKAKCSASGKVEIIDLGSTNGTYVNGRRQLYRVLREGDKLQFGEKTVFRFAFFDEVDEQFQSRLIGTPFLDRTTNTLTRERFLEALAATHAEATSSGQELAAVVMAIDGFDLVEQLLGLAVRDYFLREVGWIIRKTVAGEAALYRVDPDAFATIFRGLPLQAAMEATERIRRVVSSSRLTYQGDEMRFSLGMGVCSLSADKPADAEAMLGIAETRCRHATAAGGDRVEAASG